MRKFYVAVTTLLGTISIMSCFNYFINAGGSSIPYAIGDRVYYAGDSFSYVGSDGNNLLLLSDQSIDNQATWNVAKSTAVTYKNGLGNIGKTLVTSALPTTNDLRQAAVLNNGIEELYTSVPKIASSWWLGDIDLQADNLAKFISENNKREYEQDY